MLFSMAYNVKFELEPRRRSLSSSSLVAVQTPWQGYPELRSFDFQTWQLHLLQPTLLTCLHHLHLNAMELRSKFYIPHTFTTNEVRRYDSCFLKWYSESMLFARPRLPLTSELIKFSEYLRGKGTEDECAPLFASYKTCLTVRHFSRVLSSADLEVGCIERAWYRQDAG